MRPLTPNEKFLLGLLVFIAFAGANFFGYRTLQTKSRALDLEYASLRADAAEARVSLASEGLWKQRESWVAKHEPMAGEEGDAKAQTLQFIQAGARGKGLQVIEQSLGESTNDAGGLRVEVALTVKGSMEGIAQWLSALQDPASFYSVPYLSLKADTDQKAIIGSVKVDRYFRKGSA